ncbi:prephenate dehydratase [Aquisediminimonas sediminicola]|uniref:prephenate dehydratase n=1 Tax=Alteraquisediminimonas sediminicola TaxID=2676787 RepID=UPI001C8DE781|nr:prephenate dehydratase [Aquisediminimonas sediminicola]
MENYPEPARRLVAQFEAQAAINPANAVAFQGAPGANSHLAVKDAFPDAVPLPCFAFEDALDAVRDGKADRALIPIENSLHGRVADMHFLLPESGLSIIGEYFLTVRHCLLGRGEVSDVREAMSHPQALGQCRKWLRDHHIRPVAYADTAAAAAFIAAQPQPGIAAIAPALAAELYGLDILARQISDEAHNVTRFVELARAPITLPLEESVMTTLTFEVRNIPAALFKAMGGFATEGVNMTKLESYQRGGSFAATEFYADIEGHPDQPHVARALDDLRHYSKWVRLLGTYRKARERG